METSLKGISEQEIEKFEIFAALSEIIQHISDLSAVEDERKKLEEWLDIQDSLVTLNHQYGFDALSHVWTDDLIKQFIEAVDQAKVFQIQPISPFLTINYKEFTETSETELFYNKFLNVYFDKVKNQEELSVQSIDEINYIIKHASFDHALSFLFHNIENTTQFDRKYLELQMETLAIHPHFFDKIKAYFDKPDRDLKTSMTLIKTLKYAHHYFESHAVDDKQNRYRKLLEQIIESEDNFFIHEIARQSLEKPCEYYPVDLKRKYLEANKGIWEQYVGFESVREGKNVEELSEREVETYFKAWRDADTSFFSWVEHNDNKNRYDDEVRKMFHRYEPKGLGNSPRDGKYVSESVMSHITGRFGVIYNTQGSIDSFIKFDEETENQMRQHIETYGEISEDGLRNHITRLEKALKEGSERNILKEIYTVLYSKDLPQWMRDKYEDNLLFVDGGDLTQDDFTEFGPDDDVYDRLKYLNSFSQRIVSNIHKKQEKIQAYIQDLKDLLEKRRMNAQEKYFGYKSENVSDLSLYSQYVEKSPSKGHFSINFYLYLRDLLPVDLVHEFETKFQIQIPENLKTFENFDAYIATPPERFSSVFPSKHLLSATRWLSKRLSELDKKIQDTLPKPEIVSVFQILIEEGFLTKEMDKDSFDRTVAIYQTLMDVTIRRRIELEFNIKLSNFHLREQMQFLNYITTKSVEDVKNMRIILSRYGNEAIKAFLSLEFDKNNGDAILEIADQFDEPVVRAIFQKFNEITSLVYEKEEELVKHFYKEKAKDIHPMSEIMQRANRLLINFRQILPQYTLMSDEAKKRKNEELLVSLERINKEIVFFTSLFKTAYKQDYALRLEDVIGVSYQYVAGPQFREQAHNVNRAKEIYKGNYEKQYPQKFVNALLGGFDEKLENPNTMIDVLEYNGELIGFLAFTDGGIQDDGKRHTYFGSFNVDSSYMGSKLGEAMLHKVIQREMQDAVIDANCVPETPIARKYIEMGFVATGLIELEGVVGFDISYNTQLNEKLATKRMTEEDLMGIIESKRIKRRVFKEGESYDLSLLNEGYVLTRFFERNGYVYAIFESVIHD